jgi:hypothetical protein
MLPSSSARPSSAEGSAIPLPISGTKPQADNLDTKVGIPAPSEYAVFTRLPSKRGLSGTKKAEVRRCIFPRRQGFPWHRRLGGASNLMQAAGNLEDGLSSPSTIDAAVAKRTCTRTLMKSLVSPVRTLPQITSEALQHAREPNERMAGWKPR